MMTYKIFPHKITFLFTIIFNLTQIFSIRFNIDGNKKKDLCISKEFNLEEEITLSYVISSRHHSDKCNILLLDPDNVIVYKNYNSIQGEIPTRKSTKAGEYKFCITPLTKSKILANVEFHKKEELELSKVLAKDGSLKIK
jgi:hypothetical protein